MMKSLGLIAGNRRFPILFAKAAKKNGIYVVAAAIKGDTDFRLKKFVDEIFWLNLWQLEQMVEIFKKKGITEIVMAGQISPERLFSSKVRSSLELKSILDNLKDKRADTIFKAIAQHLELEGFKLLDSTIFMQDFLIDKGLLSLRAPTQLEEEDIDFGLSLAKEIARLDIGQVIAVKEKCVLAVEAFEGTDNLISRVGRILRLTGGGATIIKVSRPTQDMRFDIPVVGLKTIRALVKAKASCLAIEAKKTLFIDKEESLRLANKKGISIIAV